MPTRYLNEAEKRIGRKHLLWYEIYNGIASTFLGDTLVVLLAAYFGAGNMTLAYISGALYMAGLVLPFVPRLLDGRNLEKAHAFFWMMRGVVSLGYLALFFLSGRAAVFALVLVYSLFCIFRCVGIMMNDYSQKSVSSLQNRGDLISRSSTAYNEVSVVAKVVSFLATSIQKVSLVVSLVVLQMVGVVANVFSAMHLARIPCRTTIAYNPKRSMFKVMALSFQDSYKAASIVAKWLFQTAAIVLAMSVPFLNDIVGMPSNIVLLYTVFGCIALALAGVASREFSDRLGSRPLIIIGGFALSVVCVLWTIIPPDGSTAVFMVLGFLYNFLCQFCINLVNRLIVQSIPDDEAITYNSMVNFGLGVTALLGSFLAGALANGGMALSHGEGGTVFNAFGFDFGNGYSFTYLLAFCIVFVATFLVIRIREHRSLSTPEAAQALFSVHGLRAFSMMDKLGKTMDPLKRKILLMNLGNNVTNVSTAEIHQKLASPFSYDKQDFIRALAVRPRPELVEDLIRIASDDDSYVQMDAIAALGAYKDNKAAKDALVRLLYCRWSQVRSMASKSLSRVTHSSEYLEAVNELSASARHIDEEIDFLIAKRNMDKQGLFYRDFLVSVEQGRSATFRQTRYAVIASFLKFGSPRLAQLYQMMNCSGSSSAFIDDFLPEARDLDEVDASYDEIVRAFGNGDWGFVLGFCMRLCENSNLEDSRMVNLREGILKARSFDIERFDEQDFLALLYFSYSLRKNSK